MIAIHDCRIAATSRKKPASQEVYIIKFIFFIIAVNNNINSQREPTRWLDHQKGVMSTKEEDREKIALFRFALIAPIVNSTFEARSKEEYFRILSKKEHKSPDGSVKRFSPQTYKSWLASYRIAGFKVFTPQGREAIWESPGLLARRLLTQSSSSGMRTRSPRERGFTAS
jgi:hypothetical protein